MRRSFGSLYDFELTCCAHFQIDAFEDLGLGPITAVPEVPAFGTKIDALRY